MTPPVPDALAVLDRAHEKLIDLEAVAWAAEKALEDLIVDSPDARRPAGRIHFLVGEVAEQAEAALVEVEVALRGGARRTARRP